MNVEFEVLNTRKLARFIDKEIGTEYETMNNKFDFSGYITCFDLTEKEIFKIKEFIKNLK